MKIKQLIAVLLIVGVAQTQLYTGGKLKHLDTGIITLDPVDDATTVRRIETFSQILSRAGIFDATDTSIFIATSLRDYSAQGIQIVANSSVRISVDYVRLNAAKTILLLDLNTLPFVVNAQPLRVPVYRVRFNYIVVGSGMAGYYDNTLESSFIFARNGQLNTDLNLIGNRTFLYDFHNSREPSPFNYDVDPVVNVGCGAVRRNGKWILENSPTNCAKFKIYTFATGFQQTKQTTPTTTNVKFNFYDINYKQAIAKYNVTLGTVNLNPIFSSSSGLDGLPLVMTEQAQSRVQISMVCVGIREYNRNTYPQQSVSVDPYKFNGFSAPYFYNDAGTTPLIVTPFTITATPTEMKVATANVRTDIYDPASINGVDRFYYPAKASEVAHLFCGPSSLTINQVPVPMTKVDFKLTNIDVDYTTGFKFNLQANQPLPIRFYYLGSCTMFTGSSQSTVCSQSYQNSPVNIAIPIKIVSSPTTNIGTDLPTVSPPANVYAAQYDANFIANLNTLLLQQTILKPGTIEYTMAYTGVEAGKVYEAVLHVSAGNNPLYQKSGANAYFSQTIVVQIFGNVVYRDTTRIEQGVTPLTIHLSFLNSANKDSLVKITYTTDLDASATAFVVSPSYTNFLQFGIVEHFNVLNANGLCEATCEQKTGISVGVDYANIPPVCIECNTLNTNQVFDPQTGKCGCNKAFVSINDICTACTMPLCDVCSVDMSRCNICTTNAIYIDPNVPGSGCKCLDQFYRSDQKCVACPIGCNGCTAATTCTACVNNGNTRSDRLNGCACLPGRYEANVLICPKCAPECLTCQTTATNCLTCDSAKKFSKVGTTCACENGYFKVVTASNISNIATCELCDSSCSKCSSTATNCIECTPFRVRNLNGLCECASGYIQINKQCVDVLCSVIPNCQSCYILLGTGQQICRTCTGDRTPSPDFKKCVCKANFYETSAGNCAPCGKGCQSCESPEKCNICGLQALNAGDGTCFCPPKSYIDLKNNQVACLLCDSNCLTCQGSSSNCQQCTNGFISQSNVCVCPAGFYSTFGGFQCLKCQTGCRECKSSNQCDVCDSSYKLNAADKTCQLNCPSGTFDGGDKCIQCGLHCSYCLSSLSCTSCFNGYIQFAGSCRESCPSTTYQSGGICIACAEPCKTCSSFATNCSSCIAGYIFNGGKCLSDCPQKTYYNGNICISCSTECFNCYNSPNNCISCPTEKYLVDGKCVSNCPYVLVEGRCTQNCPSQFYYSGRTCLPCEGQCFTCSSQTKCDTCKSNLLSYKGACISNCPTNTLAIDKYCVECDASCVGCSITPRSCFSCKAGYRRFEEKCVQQCPIKTYLDISTNSCKPCDFGCSSCTGAGRCNICDDLSNPNSGVCTDTCGSNCLRCENKVCTLCADGYIISLGACQTYCPSGSAPVSGQCVCNSGILHLNSCISQCPTGYTQVKRECQKCQQPCLTCSGDSLKCTSCISGFNFDPVNNRCTKNFACPYGYYASLNGDCRLICPYGFFFLDVNCYENGCPIGYVTNTQSRTCQLQSISTGCTRPYFLQGKFCLTNCNSGFYPNDVNRICEACPSNCYACRDSTLCAACSVGFRLQSNICVASAGCPSGFFDYNGNCLRSCPDGTSLQSRSCRRACPFNTYFWNGGCYSPCPTNLRTADACVLLCPIGYQRSNSSNICELPTQTCPSGQFYSLQNFSCQRCTYPCAECIGASATCTKCPTGFTLNSNLCTLSNVRICPQKCGSCSQQNVCATCASGYVNTGNDCVRNVNVLNTISLQQISLRRQGNLVEVVIRPSILPNSLPSSIASRYFIFSPTVPSVRAIINQWIDNGDVHVVFNHIDGIPTYQAFLIPNSPLLGDIYKNMGYILADSYITINISSSIPTTGGPIVIPITSSGTDERTLSTSSLNKNLNKAISQAYIALARRDIN